MASLFHIFFYTFYLSFAILIENIVKFSIVKNKFISVYYMYKSVKEGLEHYE